MKKFKLLTFALAILAFTLLFQNYSDSRHNRPVTMPTNEIVINS